MRTGKVPETVLRRSVLGRIHAEGSLRYREFYGEDCAFLSLQEAVPGSGEDAQQDAKDRQGTAGAARGREETGAEGPAPFLKTEKMAAYTSVCAVPGFERHPGKLVLAAANNLCAGGAHPAALMLQAVIPDWYEESSLQRDMDEIAAQAGFRRGEGSRLHGYRDRDGENSLCSGQDGEPGQEIQSAGKQRSFGEQSRNCFRRL